MNSGRLSTPHIYANSARNTPDADNFKGKMMPGAPASDAPIVANGEPGWLLDRLGRQFNGLYFADVGGMPSILNEIRALSVGDIPVKTIVVLPRGAARPTGVEIVDDVDGLVRERYDAEPGTFYLLRPDQHVCARWRRFDASAARAALLRATANEKGQDA